MTDHQPLTTIGRAEQVSLPALLGGASVTAKVDTGADVSSLWASAIRETDAGLEFCAFGPSSPQYTGQVITVAKADYRVTRVANSFGHREERFVIQTPIRLKGRRVLATFTLADRSNKTYPMLLGRRLLQGKFVVNVAEGQPLKLAEQAKKAALKLELKRKTRDD
jgi:hypothetical protein